MHLSLLGLCLAFPPIDTTYFYLPGDSTPRGVLTSCACEFVRYAKVDNAAADRVLKKKDERDRAIRDLRPRDRSLESCEIACCAMRTCHSVTWRGSTNGSSTCTASLTSAHGARRGDRCWHPAGVEGAVSSIRAPGPWEMEERIV